jgi:hypothetical protein
MEVDKALLNAESIPNIFGRLEAGLLCREA